MQHKLKAKSIQRVTDLSHTNRSRVIRALIDQDDLTRKTIANETGLAASTVSNIVSELVESGVVYTSGKKSHHSVGRREEVISRDPRAASCVAVHYTTDTLMVSMLDFSYQIRASAQRSIDSVSAVDLSNTISSAIEELVGREDEDPAFIALSLPNHPFGRPDVTRRIEQRFGLPTYSLNNVESMATYFSQHSTRYRDTTFSLIYVGTGVGSALVLDGEVYQGAHGNASDLGHVHIRASQRLCRCGRTGCLETFASERALAQWVAEQYGMDSVLQGSELAGFLLSHLHDPDGRVLALLESATIDLAKGVYNLVALSDPGHVVVVSRLNILNPVFSEMLRRNYYEHAREPAGARTEIAFEDYVSDAGLIGAGIFGFRNYFGFASH